MHEKLQFEKMANQFCTIIKTRMKNYEKIHLQGKSHVNLLIGLFVPQRF